MLNVPIFPATAMRCSLVAQRAKVISEVHEIDEAMDAGDLDHAAEEAIDAATAAVTMAWKLVGGDYEKLLIIALLVAEKNKAREYMQEC